MKSKSFSIRLLSLCLLLFIGTLSGYSQETRKFRHWSVGASFFTVTGHVDRIPYLDDKWDYANYVGVSLDGTYRVKIYKAFTFNPELSLYYAIHGRDMKWVGGLPPRVKELGIGLRLPFGFHLPYRKVAWDFVTGPSATQYYWQKIKFSDGYEGFKTNHLMFRWMFGAAVNFWKDRLYVKLNYEITMSDYWTSSSGVRGKGQNVFTVGLGCNL